MLDSTGKGKKQCEQCRLQTGQCFHLHTVQSWLSTVSAELLSHPSAGGQYIYGEAPFLLQSTDIQQAVCSCVDSNTALYAGKKKICAHNQTRNHLLIHSFKDHTGTLQHQFVQFNISADRFFFRLIVQALCKLTDTGLR